MGGGGNGLKRCQSAIGILPKQQDFGELEETNLYLSSSPDAVADQRLYLPRSDTAPCSLDVYLQSIPAVADRNKQLFSHPQQDTAVLKNAASAQKCLNVLQGEVAHCSEDQTDMLVSAEATTCHVVALRSTHVNNTAALASMAHVDQADVYEHCLEKMVQEHLQHHLDKAMADESDDMFGFYDDLEDDKDDECYEKMVQENLQHHLDKAMADESDDMFGFYDDLEDDEDDECYCDYDEQQAPDEPQRCQRHNSFLPLPEFLGRPLREARSMPSMPVEMELHIAGGYLDDEGTSQGLSTSLVHSFSKLADKYQGQLRISLSTAAISSMNTTSSGPRSRGLALNTHTGEVTSVATALPSALDGPAMELRNARLWGEQSSKPELAVIHTPELDGITIDPFQYQPQPQLDALLKVPDPVLLQVTSTSPQYESERFCTDLRRTLSFVNTVPAHQVFGGQQKPLVYSRSSNAMNEWEPVRVAAG